MTALAVALLELGGRSWAAAVKTRATSGIVDTLPAAPVTEAIETATLTDKCTTT